MIYHLEELLILWLGKMGYSTHTKTLKTRLLSHPDYPGLIAITDTLTDLSIDNTAAQLSHDTLKELNEPFMAYIQKGNEEQFVYVEPLGNGTLKVYRDAAHPLVVSFAQFSKLWTGLIVACDRNESRSFQWKEHRQSLALCGTLACALVLFCLNNPPVGPVLHFVLSLAGLLVCSLIVGHELQAKNALAAKFCSLGRNLSCDAVLGSGAATLFAGIKLSDAGLVFFSAQTLAWLLGGVAMEMVMASQALVSLIALPFTLFSVYYQGAVVKKWCPLCLAVVSILWLQAISFAGFYADMNAWPAGRFLLLLPLAVAMASLGWMLLKPLLKDAMLVPGLSTENLTFRRNHHLFLPYYNAAPVTAIPDRNIPGIVVGNRIGNTELLLVSNPLCNACIKAHRKIKQLLEKYDDLRVRIRFYVPVEERDEPRLLVAAKLLELYGNDPDTGIMEMNKWYAEPDPAKFLKRHSSQFKVSDLETLKAHRQWCHENEVYTTPALFINGKRFPPYYNVSDIEFFIEHIMENEVMHQPHAV
ncbi:MAG TPA: vitamin K epoxide reductase family protein [Flavisolibacter sp.]|jgi:uncharacterized membrane protein/glutaredoxin